MNNLRATLVEIGDMIESVTPEADAWALLTTICSMARGAVDEDKTDFRRDLCEMMAGGFIRQSGETAHG